MMRMRTSSLRRTIGVLESKLGRRGVRPGYLSLLLELPRGNPTPQWKALFASVTVLVPTSTVALGRRVFGEDGWAWCPTIPPGWVAGPGAQPLPQSPGTVGCTWGLAASCAPPTLGIRPCRPGACGALGRAFEAKPWAPCGAPWAPCGLGLLGGPFWRGRAPWHACHVHGATPQPCPVGLPWVATAACSRPLWLKAAPRHSGNSCV